MARIQQQTLDSSIPATAPRERPVWHRVRSASLYAETLHRLQRSTTALFGLGHDSFDGLDQRIVCHRHKLAGFCAGG